jgi:hypothetical protein
MEKKYFDQVIAELINATADAFGIVVASTRATNRRHPADRGSAITDSCLHCHREILPAGNKASHSRTRCRRSGDGSKASNKALMRGTPSHWVPQGTRYRSASALKFTPPAPHLRTED